MKLSKKQFSLIIIGIVALLCVWYVNVKLKDHKSFLFQLRELAFPTKHSQGQVQNFQADLSYAAKQWRHHDLGKQYFQAGEYEKSIEEYKKAVEIAQQDPRDWAQIDNQKFARGRLMEVYEKAGRFKEAIEQIDWLLAHGPSESVRSELLTWKNVITAEQDGQYEKALEHIDIALNSADLKRYKFVIQKLSAKREEIQRKPKP